jgi:hypothetical protein
VSRWMSAKIVCLLAAAAFVVVFRVHASDNNAPIASAAPLTAARASALESEGAAAKRPASKLVAVAALPSLGHESKARIEARKRAEARARKAAAHRRKVLAARRKAAAHRRAKAKAAAAAAARRKAATPPPAATATPVPTPVYHPPVTVTPKRSSGSNGSYVGKGFDSKG